MTKKQYKRYIYLCNLRRKLTYKELQEFMYLDYIYDTYREF